MNEQKKILAATKYHEELIFAFARLKLIEFSYEDEGELISSYYAMKSDNRFYFEESFLSKVCHEEIDYYVKVEVLTFKRRIRKQFLLAKKEDLLGTVKEQYEGLLEIIYSNIINGTPRKILEINGSKIRISDKIEKIGKGYRTITKPIRDCL